jgi:hypothetical protein
MLISLIIAARFIIGIVQRLRSDAYYRSLGIVTLIMLLIGTLFTWLVGKWPFVDAMLYAVTTMSMNTPYGGPLTRAAGTGMKCFHLAYTFLSVGVFIIFTMETGKTMLATHKETMKMIAERRAKKAAAKRASAADNSRA